MKREMLRAMERHQNKDSCVIPVILRQCYWQGAPFGKLQALPTDAKPVIGGGWKNRDEAFTNIVHGIRAIVNELAPKASCRLPIEQWKAEKQSFLPKVQLVLTVRSNLEVNPRLR